MRSETGCALSHQCLSEGGTHASQHQRTEHPAFEEVSGAVTPTISALEPDTCAIGDPDFDLHVTGENFTTASIIYFAGHDEPTTLNEDGTVSHGRQHGDVARAGYGERLRPQRHAAFSNALEFTFTEAGRRAHGRVTNFLRTLNWRG